MTQQTAPLSAAADVRVEIAVETPIERAFAVFTSQIDTWWPRPYRLGTAERANLVIEPHIGGRWYEQGTDGSEADWGKVLVWEPPRHLVLSNQVGVSFTPQTDPERASRVDVQFVADGPNRTIVTLVHSQFERHGEGWQNLRDAVAHEGGGWPGLLRAYQTFVAQAAS